MWDLYKGLPSLHLSTGNALLEREKVNVRPQWYTEFAVTSALLIFFSETYSSSPAI